MMTKHAYPVFLISDSTAITVETVARGILAQFPDLLFELQTFRFVDGLDKLNHACMAIRTAQQHSGRSAVVLCSLVDAAMHTRLHDTGALVIDIMQPIVESIAQHWQSRTHRVSGRTHGVNAIGGYERRIEALNFALLCDDGVQTTRYGLADMILIGVSRSGKTPTALYLAMHYGVFVANYPLDSDELATGDLPPLLQPFQHKLFGLAIQVQRLYEIRQQRRPGSQYATWEQCQTEVRQQERLFQYLRIPYIDVTTRSIEEVAGQILVRLDGIREAT